MRRRVVPTWTEVRHVGTQHVGNSNVAVPPCAFTVKSLHQLGQWSTASGASIRSAAARTRPRLHVAACNTRIATSIVVSHTLARVDPSSRKARSHCQAARTQHMQCLTGPLSHQANPNTKHPGRIVGCKRQRDKRKSARRPNCPNAPAVSPMPLAPLAAAAKRSARGTGRGSCGAQRARAWRWHRGPHLRERDRRGPAVAAHVNSGATDHARVVERKSARKRHDGTTPGARPGPAQRRRTRRG